MRGSTQGYKNKAERLKASKPKDIKFHGHINPTITFDPKTAERIVDNSEYEAFMGFTVNGVKLRDVLIPAYYDLIERKNATLAGATPE